MWPLNRKAKTKPAKKAAKRGVKQAQSLKRRRRLSFFLRGATLLVVCSGMVTSVYIWKSGLLHKWLMEVADTVDRQIADAGYIVGEVRITGQENTTLKQVRKALALYDGQSIVSLDLEKILIRVEALPWVKKATIIRTFPDGLDVTIAEHQAMALWQENGRLYLVDQAGAVITGEGTGKFVDLPHVVGAEANENLAGLLAMDQAYPDLFARVKSFVWVGRRRWDLNFQNGVKIKLPEKGSALAWQRLYQYESKQKILAKEVLSVDFRLTGKTVLRLTPAEAERRRQLIKASGKQESI